jgi:hypothetical protein
MIRKRQKSVRPGTIGGPDAHESERLQRIARLLREIEEEGVRLVEGSRGASALSIVSRAATARRYLDDLLDQEPVRVAAVAEVEAAYLRRIRTGIHELRLSAGAAANLLGLTEEEVAGLLRGVEGRLPLDLLERVAHRLEAEQQLAMEPLVAHPGG